MKLGDAYAGSTVRWRRGRLQMVVRVEDRRDGMVIVRPIVGGRQLSAQLWNPRDQVEPVERRPRPGPEPGRKVAGALTGPETAKGRRPAWLVRLVHMAAADPNAGAELRRAARDAARAMGVAVDGSGSQALHLRTR